MGLVNLVTIGMSFISLFIWILVIMGGVNLPGIKNWFFVKISRVPLNAMVNNDPLTMWNTNNVINMNPLDPLPTADVQPTQLSLSLRNWCLSTRKLGRDSNFYRLWDTQTIPSYEIDQRDDYADLVQCVHPKIALKSPKSILTIAEIAGVYMSPNMANSPMFAKTGSYYVGIESMHYIVLFTTLFAFILFALQSRTPHRLVGFISILFVVVAVLFAIIIVTMWSFTIYKLQGYVDTSTTTLETVAVSIGPSFWLAVVGLILLLVLSILSCLSVCKRRKSMSIIDSISSLSSTNGKQKLNFKGSNVRMV